MDIYAQLYSTDSVKDFSPISVWLNHALWGHLETFKLVEKMILNATEDWGLQADLIHYYDYDTCLYEIHQCIEALCAD